MDCIEEGTKCGTHKKHRMKRYLLFAGSNYYPMGGWGDFKRDFDHLSEAFDLGQTLTTALPFSTQLDWYHIFDTELKVIITKNP